MLYSSLYSCLPSPSLGTSFGEKLRLHTSFLEDIPGLESLTLRRVGGVVVDHRPDRITFGRGLKKFALLSNVAAPLDKMRTDPRFLALFADTQDFEVDLCTFARWHQALKWKNLTTLTLCYDENWCFMRTC